MSDLTHLIDLLNDPRMCRPTAVHAHECPYWRVIKRHGPCSCGASELDLKMRIALMSWGVKVEESPHEQQERLALEAARGYTRQTA